MPSMSGRVKFGSIAGLASIGFSLGVFGLHSIDAHTMAAQVPAKCERGQWPVKVPRTHIHAPMVGDNDPGPSIAVLMTNYPQFSINSMIAANQSLNLKPESLLPAASGGIICLDLPTRDKAQNSAAVIHTATENANSKKSDGKIKLDLDYKLPKTLSNEEIVSVHYAAGFRGQDLVTMSAISKAESGGYTASVCKNSGNGCNASWASAISFDGGLDQINNEAWNISIKDMFNPLVSAKTAYKIYKIRHGKFHDWVTYNHGSHKKFINPMWNAAKRVGVI